jgi:hypothetical protein
MTRTKSLGMLALAIYLLLVGLSEVIGLHLGQFSIAVPIMALVAGVLILLGR